MLKSISFSLILFGLTSSSAPTDTCGRRVQALETKVDRILYILESTFKVGRGKQAPPGQTIVGTGTPNSGSAIDPIYGGSLKPGLLNNKDLKSPRYQTSEAQAYGKGKNNNVKGSTYLAKTDDTNNYGYDDAIVAAGADLYAKDAAATQGYAKDEAYLANQNDGYVYEADYSGSRVNDSIAALIRNVVREEQDVTEEFFNDYQKENHEGDYNGNEFDVNYKSKQLNGGFNDLSAKTDAEQSRYYANAKDGSQYNEGNDYTNEKYKDADEDQQHFDRNLAIGAPRSGGHYPDDQALYDKYSGKKSSPPENTYGEGKGLYGDAKGGKGYGPEFGYNINRDYKDADTDLNENLYATEYGLNDKFGSKQNKEDSIGIKQRLEREEAFNNGKYTDVEASGFNKNANYKGDYKTNKEQKKSGFKFRNRESLEELGTPDRFASVVVNDNRVEFRGKERKSSLNSDLKAGKYTDRELNNKQKANADAIAYKDRDYINKDRNKNEKDIYYKTQKGNDINADQYKQGYKSGPKKNNDYGYYKPKQYNDNNDDYIRRQRRY